MQFSAQIIPVPKMWTPLTDYLRFKGSTIFPGYSITNWSRSTVKKIYTAPDPYNISISVLRILSQIQIVRRRHKIHICFRFQFPFSWQTNVTHNGIITIYRHMQYEIMCLNTKTNFEPKLEVVWYQKSPAWSTTHTSPKHVSRCNCILMLKQIRRNEISSPVCIL